VNRLALRPSDRVRMILPFALVALLPLVLAPLPPAGGVLLTGVYGALTLGVFLTVVALPWHRWPGWVISVPGLVYCFALFCARHAEEGARSGLALLYLLPIMFMAIYGSRRTLGVTVIGTLMAMAVSSR
jgi:hypothetical protein